jgi:hypothetical protein
MTIWEILILSAVLLIIIMIGIAFILLWRFTAGRSPLLNRLFRNLVLQAISYYDGRFPEFPYDDRYRGRFPRDPYDERLFYIIRRAEEDSGVTLTFGARQMLIIPVYEVIDSGRTIDWEQVNSSVRLIVQTAAEEVAPRGTASFGERIRNSVAVIAAFSRRFCNIPPFCAPRE